jgi:hypothetical protein
MNPASRPERREAQAQAQAQHYDSTESTVPAMPPARTRTAPRPGRRESLPAPPTVVRRLLLPGTTMVWWYRPALALWAMLLLLVLYTNSGYSWH